MTCRRQTPERGGDISTERRSHELDQLLDSFSQGDRRSLGRLLTVVEQGTTAEIRRIVTHLHPQAARSLIVGVTGAPGSGKSTLTSALITELRKRDNTVAVLAVDPSSSRSGGALLGDRIRMDLAHHADEGVFIRSTAARGHLGGLSPSTFHALSVMETAGFDVIIVETVGVGQSEVDVARVADTTVVVVAPGMGDDVQAAKAGVLEIADVFVINKADYPGAAKLEAELRSMLRSGEDLRASVGEDSEWRVPVVRTVAIRAEGVSRVVDAIHSHNDFRQASADPDRWRRARTLEAVKLIAMERVQQLLAACELDARHPGASEESALLDLDPYAAADQLLTALRLA